MRALILLMVALAACNKPKLAPVDGKWFRVSVPTTWSECKTKAPFELCRSYDDSKAHQVTTLQVSAPLLVDGDLSTLLETSVRGVAGKMAMTTRTPEATTVAGVRAVTAPIDAQKDEGTDVAYRLWALERNGFGVIIVCGASGFDAVRLETPCADIVKSFEFTTPMEPTKVVHLEPRRFGPLLANLPKTWVDAAGDEAAQGIAAGARAPQADHGVVPAMLLSVVAPATDLQSFALTFTPPEGAERMSQRNQTLKLGPGLTTQFHMKKATGLIYQVVTDGVGFRFWCVFPREEQDVYAPVCDAIATTAVISPQ